MKKVLGISLGFVFIYSVIITILYINTTNNLKNTNNNLEELNKKYDVLVHTEAMPITTTFYAQIENVDLENNFILVKGLDFDTIYNKKYLLKISDKTFLIGNGNTGGSNILNLSCFENNQYVSVTYEGVIENSENYDIIDTIQKVQLLENRNE